MQIVPKAHSVAITWHSGDGKNYAMPRNETLVGGGGLLLTPVSSPSMKVTYASLRSGQVRDRGLMIKSSNAHTFFLMERFEIFTICRRLTVLQTDASVGMMKKVDCVTEACKVSDLRTSTHRQIGIETLLWAAAHGNTFLSVGPIRVQNLIMFRALESAYNRDPNLPWALCENRKYHDYGPGCKRIMVIFALKEALMMRFFIWVFSVRQGTRLGVSVPQWVKTFQGHIR